MQGLSPLLEHYLPADHEGHFIITRKDHLRGWDTQVSADFSGQIVINLGVSGHG